MTGATSTPGRTENRLEHRIGPRGRVVIRQAAGEVRIKGVEGDRVRIASDGPRALAEHFSIEAGDDFVELCQAARIGLGILGRGESVDLRIEAPHGATLSIEGQSVEIEASDLSGTKSFRTASGDVSLHRLAGAVEVETVSGDVGVDGQAPLDLRARTVYGDVEIRVPMLRRLDLGTTSGDAVVDAELRGDGPFAVRTISGDVMVVGRSGFRVEAESITGDLASEVPAKRESLPGRKVLIVGRPGPTLTFRSVSGDFLVTEARGAAAVLEADPATEARSSAPAAGATRGDARDVSEPAREDADTKRLAILRRLERGEISVAEAGERLAQLDEVVR